MKNVPMFVLLVCATAAPSALPSGCLAADKTVQPQERLRFLLAGMKNEREQLRRGVFRAHGVKVVEERPPIGKLQGEVHIFGAFDLDKDCLRFDREEPMWKPLKRGQSLSGPREQEIWIAKYCRSPDFSAQYHSGYKRIEIHPPEATRLSSMPGSYGFFDVRCLGLYYIGNFLRGDKFEEVHQHFMSVVPQECVDEGGGLYRFRWPSPDGHVRQTLWINEKQAYSPVRFTSEIEYRDEWLEPFLVNDVTWQQVSGRWVAKSFRICDKEALEPTSEVGPDYEIEYRVMTWTLAFDWEAVNRPIPEKYFHYDDFDPPKGTYVTDWRSGKSVMKKVIGVDMPGLESDATSAAEGLTAARLLVIAGTVLVVLAAVAYWWRRRAVR